jgi:hypothetical protein
MEILGASIIRSAQSFLHAGYISSSPYPFGKWSSLTDMLGESAARSTQGIEVAEALRVNGEPLLRVPGADAAGRAAAISTSYGNWPATAAAVVCFFLGLWLAYWLRRRLNGRFRWLSVALPVVSVMLALTCFGMPPLLAYPDRPPVPWEGVPLVPYRDPEKATQVLLHGIIADGLINAGRPIDNLAEIQHEIGLPLKSLTSGQSYALQTYGIDGWGREFRLAKGDNQYTVTSAGSDGRFDTGDDMSVTVAQCTKDMWDWYVHRHAYFIRKVDQDYLMFIHRWKGRFFRYNNEVLARTLTGDSLFDVLTATQVTAYGHGRVDHAPALRDAYESAVAASTATEPLVLCVFSPSP